MTFRPLLIAVLMVITTITGAAGAHAAPRHPRRSSHRVRTLIAKGFSGQRCIGTAVSY